MSFTGNLNVWAQLLHAGATLVLATNLRSTRWRALLDRYPVTLLYLVPVKLKLLLQVLEKEYPSLKMVLARFPAAGCGNGPGPEKAFSPEPDPAVLRSQRTGLHHLAHL